MIELFQGLVDNINYKLTFDRGFEVKFYKNNGF